MSANFNPSPTLEAFLAAEVRNEADGGSSPTTLASAMDSLYQMPADVFRDLNSGTRDATKSDTMLELQNLVEVFGTDFEPEPVIDMQAGYTSPRR